MEEILNLYLDEPPDSKLIITPPNENIKGKNILEVQVNPKIKQIFT